MLGEKKGTSRPATTDVFVQSNRILATRKRISPEVSEPYPAGKPPKKSIWRLALVRAPKTSGPNPLSPMVVCRKEAPTLPGAAPGGVGVATLGTSVLSTCPETPDKLRRTRPESFIRYLEALPTLSCSSSATRAFTICQSSAPICAGRSSPDDDGDCAG